jgi:hypothetical protein
MLTISRALQKAPRCGEAPNLLAGAACVAVGRGGAHRRLRSRRVRRGAVLPPVEARCVQQRRCHHVLKQTDDQVCIQSVAGRCEVPYLVSEDLGGEGEGACGRGAVELHRQGPGGDESLHLAVVLGQDEVLLLGATVVAGAVWWRLQGCSDGR